MFNKIELEQWLDSIGQYITEPIKVFMIGGGALSFRNMKPATKDVDLVVKSKHDLDILSEAIIKSGFKQTTDFENEFYLTALAVFMKEDSRIDVFLKQIGKMLTLTQSMIQRAEHYKDYGKLSIYLVSNEDIFLFKSMTTRDGDILDCDSILAKGISYETVYEEVVNQSKQEHKWFFWVYESLCKLEEHNNIRLPIKNRVFFLVKEHWKDKPSDFMSDVKDLEKHISDKKLLKEFKK